MKRIILSLSAAGLVAAVGVMAAQAGSTSDLSVPAGVTVARSASVPAAQPAAAGESATVTMADWQNTAVRITRRGSVFVP